ncbi:hypothetical protein BDV37DRAFT_291453 [Aspergillus pseudonomiae]|uniref:Zn(2)-C6 fungal-type domain-containing protein n=1 Tax=Aspergillus pseudonomiae TaxID=1506151 RepID=A0A5N7CWT6_9EURO|nr:uncharacterized protein BDV37DRAFT_291453 [Aspergillus pseudonomiae]KAE8398053.1 hypothetical protein BDV37DRAFT_291453 [Aspergillus pseudonomiae]
MAIRVYFIQLVALGNQFPTPPQRRRDGCSECRRKKVKCDLRRPVCSRCTRFPKECRYGQNFVGERQRLKRQDASEQPPHSPIKPKVSLCTNMDESVVILPRQIHLNPSPFLSTEQYLFFLRLFATETAPRLFPAAPSIFVHQLVNRALETPHLLHALLASASSHHGRLMGDTAAISRTATLKFTSYAVSGLRAALNSPEEMLKAETTMTALALSTNDICNGNRDIWQAHLSGATRLLAAFLDRHAEAPSVADPFDLCLVKWFATLDVMANLTGIRTSLTDRDPCWYLDKIPDAQVGYVDDISGYSPELIPMLAQLGQMAGRQDLFMAAKCGAQFTLPRQLLEEAQELEYRIRSITDRTVSDSTSKNHDSALTVDLQHTHRAFVHASLLHLHRRVQLLPRDHSQVKEDITNIVNAVLNIDPFSPANILILWPMFTAGCETSFVSERDLIQKRMANMQSLGLGNYTRARDMLRMFWSSGSLLPWDIYFAEQGIQLVLF